MNFLEEKIVKEGIVKDHLVISTNKFIRDAIPITPYVLDDIANIITSCRILCSMGILCFPAFSPEFYTMYFLCGFSDMIDGTIARKTNAVSEFGSKLDTVADFVFVVVCLIKLLPMRH